TAAPPLARACAGSLPPDGDPDARAISRDGRTLYFASNEPGADRGGQSFSRIYGVPTDGSAAPKVLAGSAGAAVASPPLPPDGSRLAYLSVTAPAYTPGRTALMLMDLKSGRNREVTPGLDSEFNQLAWSADGSSLLATGQHRGQVALYRVDPANGHITTVSGDGSVSAFDSARNTLVYVNESLGSPQQLFVQQGSAPARQLTHAGAAILADTPLSPAEQF